MPKFTFGVYYSTRHRFPVTVEADSLRDAVEGAFAELPDGLRHILGTTSQVGVILPEVGNALIGREESSLSEEIGWDAENVSIELDNQE